MAGGIPYTNKYLALSEALKGGSKVITDTQAALQAEEDRKRKLLKEEEDKANTEALASGFEAEGTPESKILGGMARTGDVGSAGNLYGIGQANKNLQEKEKRLSEKESKEMVGFKTKIADSYTKMKADKRLDKMREEYPELDAAMDSILDVTNDESSTKEELKASLAALRGIPEKYATLKTQAKTSGGKTEVMENRLELTYREKFENSQPIKSLLNVANPLAKVTYAEDRFNEISKDPKATMEKISAARNNADQLLVVAYTKLGDETSVVMPSEFERYFQGSSVFQKMKNLASQGLKGGLKISNSDREEIKKTIEGTMEIYKENAKDAYIQAKKDEADLNTRPGFITGKIDKYLTQKTAEIKTDTTQSGGTIQYIRDPKTGKLVRK
ncbi:MAG: hypothetical protein WC716_16470 [Chitinophagaceae bacterium]|jgi:hypothetical protein